MKQEHIEEMKARARNICLKLAYDGTHYHGFQRQMPPVIAVQNLLERRLEKIFGDRIELAAAGRTDAGVHAKGQVVNFFTDGKIPVERIVRATNGILPDDIVILEAYEADRDFSARHHAKAKTYCYRILQGDIPDPFRRNYCWYIRRPLDVEKMQEACDLICGVHDFSSFRGAGGAPMSPVREIYSADALRQGDEIVFLFYGNGFLYHMVRNLIGTLVRVGHREISVEEFQSILDAKDRRRAAATAPAQGLCLMSVEYE